MWHYNYSGLTVCSQMEIPEWFAFENHSSFLRPDVQIRLKSPVPEESFNPGPPSFSNNKCRFFFPEAGEYHICNGDEIVIKPLLKAKKREIRLFLLGTAWGVLNYQRGHTIFHAAAVKIRNQAVAFCGPAGSGKSTLAAWLTNKGYPVVGDDLCRLDLVHDTNPVIYPSSLRLKLWKDSLDALGWDHKKLERDYFRSDKFHLPQQSPSFRDPLPVSKIFLLDWGKLNIKRLTGLYSVKSLLTSATYRSELLGPIGQTASQWERGIQAAQSIPIWKFTRPWGLKEIEKTVQFLRKYL